MIRHVLSLCNLNEYDVNAGIVVDVINICVVTMLEMIIYVVIDEMSLINSVNHVVIHK